MSKFDHRLKRLEARTGGKKEFEYWLISHNKQIQDIKAGKIAGQRGSLFDPEKKNIIIKSAMPRPDARALEERHVSPPMVETLDPSDLSDEDLDQEIARIQKELDNGKAKKKIQ